jgi:hypothetical protein
MHTVSEGKRIAQKFPQESVSTGERPVILNFPGSAYVKITEGCSNYCSFCAIPLIRGEVRSRSIKDIICEIKSLLSKNIYEINLIGKRYEAEKEAHGDVNRCTSKSNLPTGQNGPLGEKDNSHKTRERIAKETGTSSGYVRHAGDFAKGVDAAEEVEPGIKKEILSGKFKKKDKFIAEIAKAPVEERKSLTENLRLTKPNINVSPGVKQNIKSTAVGMRNVDAPVSEESAIETLQGTVDMFIESCESTFVNYPIILVDEEYYQKVLKILDKANKYINKIKGDTN